MIIFVFKGGEIMNTRLIILLVTIIFFFLPAGAQTQTVTSVSVEPLNPHINVGDVQQFRAVGIMNDGSTRVLSQVSSHIASENDHTCAALPDGKIKCWGHNEYGQLGNASTQNTNTPAAVSGIESAAAVTTGQLHTCAVLSNGSVKCWGYNRFGQLGTGQNIGPDSCGSWPCSTAALDVSGINNAIAVAAGGNHACALLADGSVKCWGNNGSGQLGTGQDAGPEDCNSYACSTTPVQVSGINNAVAITAGWNHSCAVFSDATAKCWGYNGNGELGNGTNINSNTPVSVSGINNALAIDGGSRHTCVLLSDGTMKCWGYNGYGELGNGTRNNSSTPVTVSGISTAADIAASNSLSCAVLSNGSVKCWGYNFAGQLGTGQDTGPQRCGSFPCSTVPVDVIGINNASDVTTGKWHTCALLIDGTARCWGNGYLGDGSHTASTVPVEVSNLSARWSVGFLDNAAGIATSGAFVCSSLTGGTVECWGNDFGSEPVPVSGISTAREIDTGGGHACAALLDGTVKCWGDNDEGQLGNGNTAPSFLPVSVSGMTSAAKVAAGGSHSCAALSNGTVQCWGDNFRGQLGTDPASANELCGSYPGLPCSTTPVTVDGINNASDVAAGSSHSCAILSNSTIKCWGYNVQGELGNGTTDTTFSPVSVSGINNAVSIAAGSFHACALLSNGNVKCWGENSNGQLGSDYTGPESSDANPPVPCSRTPIAVSGISNAIAIAAGSDNTCALISGGTVKCWGPNPGGQLGNGTTVSSFTPVTVNGINNATAIDAGGTACAVLSDGAVKCWGWNSSAGMLGIGTVEGPEMCTNPNFDPPVDFSCSTNPVQVILDTAGSVIWDSSKVAVASINNKGLARGIDDGVSTITATLGSLSASTDLTVGTAFTLTVSKQGPGSGIISSLDGWINCGADCGEAYGEGTEVTLRANADGGSLFTGWGGDPDCSDGIITMNENKNCTATFNLDVHTITIIHNGTGSGMVLVRGPEVQWVCVDNCEKTFPAGTRIFLEASPDFPDSEFAGWAGDPGCENGSVLLDADKTCTATFNLKSYWLSIVKPGNGSGTVISVSDNGIDCGNDCSELYPTGTRVTLQAIPDQWNEVSWGGFDCSEVTIGDEDVTCFAIFNIQTYTLTLDKAVSYYGVVRTGERGGINCGLDCSSAAGIYNGGTEVTIIAERTNPSLIFTGWSGDPDCDDGVVTMDADKTCTATYLSLEDLQFQQMQMLRNESQKTPEFRFENGIPHFISMRLPIPAALPDDPVIQALDFFDRYKYLYRINEPRKDFYLKRIKTNRFDEIGGGNPEPSDLEQHLFFGQQKDGIPVYGANLAMHMRGNMITSTNGNYLKDIPAFTLPAVQSPAAEAVALANDNGINKKVVGITKLFYYNRGLTAIGGGNPDPSDTPTKLAWRVMVRGLRNSDGAGTSWMYFIDAQEGTVLKVFDQLREHNMDINIKSANNTDSENCWNNQGEAVQWFDENGPADGYPGDYPGGDTDGDRAFTFIPHIYDYFHDTFGRNSYDGGDKEIEVVVHAGVNWVNAAYSSSCDFFKFGNGYTVLDIMAHEFMHGIDASKDDGGLIYENQSGALDESYSDVFGEFAEAEVRGAADWLHAVGKPGGYNRNLAHPPDKGAPDHLNDYIDTDDDNGGVHTNSGIPNKAAFLLVAGGVHPGSGIEVRGIGIDKAQRLYYDVHTARLTENSQFIDARDNSVEQAEEYRDNDEYGFTDSDVCSVMNAFAAVGLGLSDIDCDGMLDNRDDDNDNDGIGNLLDNCPYAVNPSQLDRDDDGSGNACDFDSDNDGKLNGEDNCIYTANADQADWNNNGIGNACDDSDGDGVFDSEDNCRTIANPDLQNSDNDEWGDACDGDDDNDGVWDSGDLLDDVYTPCPTNGWIVEGVIVISRCDDNCRTVANPDQTDTDEDGFGDECDNCDFLGNSDQADNDNDGIGDVCDPDDDNDGVDDTADNCQFKSNSDQISLDLNDIGLACDPGEAFMLSGNFGDFFNGNFSFPNLTDSIKIPVFPCIDDGCPDWIAENFMTEVSLSLPSGMQARVVDDRGFVISKGKAGMTRIMRFHPAADSFFRFAENMPSQAGEVRLPAEISAQAVTQPAAFRGRSYFVEIYPSADVIPGQQYEFTIRVRSGTDIDSDGSSFPDDCNDADPAINPSAVEICDGKDNNCNGQVDEGIDLNDGNACTEDRCIPELGIFHEIISPDDGNACTTDACDQVLGIYHMLVDPDDGNACTEDRCIPELGVFHVIIDPDDGNACTEDRCDPGLGVIHALVNPDDGNACTTDACDPVLGVYHILVDPDDSNACTEDRCIPELGVFHSIIDPDDGNVCTEDSCDPAAGVQHIPVNTQTWYRDGDNDGYSNGFRTESCERPDGFKTASELIAASGDCDDINVSVNPGMPEIPNNGIDDDCDPLTPAASVKGVGSNVPGAPRFTATMTVKVNEKSSGSSWLKYFYTKIRLNFMSTSITGISMSGKTATVTGTGRVNGVPDYTFTATVSDGSPDAMGIEIRKPDGSLRYSADSNTLSRGNFIVEGK